MMTPSGRHLRILLLTPYTGGNLGDAAIQDAAIYHLRDILFNPSIRLVTLAPGATDELHGVPSLPLTSSAEVASVAARGPAHNQALAAPNAGEPYARKINRTLGRVPGLRWVSRLVKRQIHKFTNLLRRAVREFRHLVQIRSILRSTDLLVFSGGGQIDDFWGGAFGHPYTLFKWSFLAKITNTRVVFLSVGVCSLKSRLSRWFSYQALKRAAYRSYRDKGSKELLRRAAFTASDPVLPDLAFSHPRVLAHARRETESNAPSAVVGISPIACFAPKIWPNENQFAYDRYLQALCDFAVKVLQAGHSVVIFTSAAMDQPTAKEFFGKFLQLAGADAWRDRLRFVAQTGLTDALNEMAKLDIVVASRLHGVILSHVLGKPVLAISYDRKVDAHMQAMELDRFCVQFDDFTAPQIWEVFSSLLADSAGVSAAVREKATLFGRQLDAQYHRIKWLFENAVSPAE